MLITQNRHAKAALQDVHSYEQTQETLALLKMLALGRSRLPMGRPRVWMRPLTGMLRRTTAASEQVGLMKVRPVGLKPWPVNVGNV